VKKLIKSSVIDGNNRVLKFTETQPAPYEILGQSKIFVFLRRPRISEVLGLIAFCLCSHLAEPLNVFVPVKIFTVCVLKFLFVRKLQCLQQTRASEMLNAICIICFQHLCCNLKFIETTREYQISCGCNESVAGEMKCHAFDMWINGFTAGCQRLITNGLSI
jgi:hypothetical protein